MSDMQVKLIDHESLDVADYENGAEAIKVAAAAAADQVPPNVRAVEFARVRFVDAQARERFGWWVVFVGSEGDRWHVLVDEASMQVLAAGPMPAWPIV